MPPGRSALDLIDAIADLTGTHPALLRRASLELQRALYSTGRQFLTTPSDIYLTRIEGKEILSGFLSELARARPALVPVRLPAELIAPPLIEGSGVQAPFWRFPSLSPPPLRETGEILEMFRYAISTRFDLALEPIFPEAISSIVETFERAFAVLMPRRIVLDGEISILDRVALECAKQHAIPSAHWLILPPTRRLDWSNLGELTGEILVSGPHTEQLLQSRGLTGIRVGGTPFSAPSTLTPPSLDAVTVFSRPMLSAAPHGMPYYALRAEPVEHAYRIQNVLRRAGVQRARIALESYESPEWYASFVDTGFYEIVPHTDDALAGATLSIGPAGDRWFASVLAGIEYYTYEPGYDFNPARYDYLAPEAPFDGTDSRVVVAMSDDHLLDLLVERPQMKLGVLEELLQPFSPETFETPVS